MTEQDILKITGWLETTILDVADGATKRQEVDFGNYTVKIYSMGNSNIRIDIIPEKGQSNNG